MKIVYFDVENYEEEFLKENNNGKYIAISMDCVIISINK